MGMGMHDDDSSPYAPVPSGDDNATPLVQNQNQKNVSIILGNPFSKRIARLLDSSDAVATRVLTDTERR